MSGAQWVGFASRFGLKVDVDFNHFNLVWKSENGFGFWRRGLKAGIEKVQILV